MVTRRQFIGNTAFLSLLTLTAAPVAMAAGRDGVGIAGMKADIAAIERARGGRLGVAVLDLATGDRVAWRGGERFASYSTFKFPLTAFILWRIDRGLEQAARIIPYGKADLVSWSPVTAPQVDKGGMSVRDLCEAQMIQSDNTAANLLLAASGGPPALTDFLRGLGDKVTRSDRTEPTANDVPPGEQRDTTTPDAMLDLMRTLLFGDALSPAARGQLTAWLIDNRTGGKRLRAGMPGGWRVGDKTGGGDKGSNDIAILWPPAGGPLLVTGYYWNPAAGAEGRNAAFAELGALIARRHGG
ncbi:class A beta-lactamase [Niveispirillum fermenti]|uniref:class A beta-lactamase n=1 Tax=Niveispirillum fermenti TaxID=1233113 RepID=UPI003A848287